MSPKLDGNDVADSKIEEQNENEHSNEGGAITSNSP